MQNRLMKCGTLLLLPSLLIGCAQNTKEVPISDVRPWRPISYSCVDSKETRRQVIAHNSVYDTLKGGRKVVYGDTCPEKAPPPKTS